VTAGTPSRESILAALRAAITLDEPYGPPGGLPERVRIDRGKGLPVAYRGGAGRVRRGTGGLRTRVAAILVLLYAQPLGRILRLTIDDIDTTRPDLLLHLGDPPTPVPEPVADLLLALSDRRTNMRTATNRDARWLFPGRRAGQPLTVDTIAPLIRDLGVPTVPGRLAALRQLVLQAPAPVVAQALGFHHPTTQRHHAAGGTWNRYTGRDG
jgi:hypothetical protein